MASDSLKMAALFQKLSVYYVLFSQFMVKNGMYMLQWNVSIKIWMAGCLYYRTKSITVRGYLSCNVMSINVWKVGLMGKCIACRNSKIQLRRDRQVDGLRGAYPSSPDCYGEHLFESIAFCRLSDGWVAKCIIRFMKFSEVGIQHIAIF